MAVSRPPEGPFAELGFYFADRDDRSALLAVTEQLLAAGGRLTGTVHVHEGQDAREPFEGPTDFSQVPRQVSGFDQLSALRSERIMAVEVAGLIGPKSRHARVTFVRVRGAGIDSHHPVHVWFSGWPIQEAIIKGRVARDGVRLVELMKQLVLVLKPAYAALLMEASLPVPEAIANDAQSYPDLRDIWLSHAFIGTADAAALVSSFPDAAVPWGEGVLMITTAALGADQAVEPAAAVRAAAKSIRRAASRYRPDTW